MTNPLEIARVGNPWLTSRSVERVVPLYVLHTFLAPNFETSPRLAALKDAVVDPGGALKRELHDVVRVNEAHAEVFGEAVEGILAADRRIFRHRQTGRASKEGSLFPALGRLVKRASDDGLGSQMHGLFARSTGDWQHRVRDLLEPDDIRDPATQCVSNLLAGKAADYLPTEHVPDELPVDDAKLVTFVDNLIRGAAGGSRVFALREFALGLYLAAIVRMIRGPIQEYGAANSSVFVFAGLPPGNQRDARVIAASQSYQSWMARSWRSTHALISDRLRDEPIDAKLPVAESRRIRLTRLVAKRMLEKAPAAVEPIEKWLGDSPDDDEEWCRLILEGPAIGLTKSELMRRFRSLGSNIGLAGPDRGIGRPRLFFDTPLLSVLVRGLVGSGRMEFETFVTKMATDLGFVVGPGRDADAIDKLEMIGSHGSDPFEIGVMNQEALRERLIRVGLARAYSDSHTEVVVND